MQKLKHISEFLALKILMLTLGLMPVDLASKIGSVLGKNIGKHMGANKKARKNISLAFPNSTEQVQDKILQDMWDNLGRVAAEYPHLKYIGQKRVELDIDEKVLAFLKEDKPFLVFSAHLGNWEIAAATMLMHFSQKLDLTYRAPNNPYVDRLLMKARSLGEDIQAYSKSREGGIQLIKAIKDNHYVAILIDQKYNEGVKANFFGHDAMTNPAFAQLAKKYNYPLIPAQIIRKKGAHFKIILHPPLDTKDKAIDKIINEAHTHLEKWIREKPGQWLWLHKRWDSAQLKKKKETQNGK